MVGKKLEKASCERWSLSGSLSPAALRQTRRTLLVRRRRRRTVRRPTTMEEEDDDGEEEDDDDDDGKEYEDSNASFRLLVGPMNILRQKTGRGPPIQYL